MTADPTNANTSAPTTECRDGRPAMPTGNRLELPDVDAAQRDYEQQEDSVACFARNAESAAGEFVKVTPMMALPRKPE